MRNPRNICPLLNADECYEHECAWFVIDGVVDEMEAWTPTGGKHVYGECAILKAAKSVDDKLVCELRNIARNTVGLA